MSPSLHECEEAANIICKLTDRMEIRHKELEAEIPKAIEHGYVQHVRGQQDMNLEIAGFLFKEIEQALDRLTAQPEVVPPPGDQDELYPVDVVVPGDHPEGE